MRRVRAWVVRLAGLFDRRRHDRDLADEIASHLEMHVEDNMRAGMNAAEAHRQALVRLGGVEAVTERCRDRRGVPALEALWLDVRFGLRVLRRSPGFTLTAALTFALGIGANAAMFSVLHAVLLRPLPYEGHDRLVRIYEVTPRGLDHNPVSSGNVLDWHDQAAAFDAMGAHGWSFGMGLAGSGEPRRVEVARLSPGALAVLGVPALVGRTFQADDARTAGQLVALLSHAVWQQQYGGDPDVVGRTIHLDDLPHLVVGVMPPGFDFPTPRIEIWLPLGFNPGDRDERRAHQWGVIARLKPGIGLESAEAAMNVLAGRSAERHPQYMSGWGVNVVGLRQDLVEDVEPLLWILTAFVGAVLLIACANLANLLLVRTGQRASEFSARAALGAGRGRLIRQLLVEVLLLGGLGGALGIACVVLLLPVLLAAMPPDIPLLDDVRIDPTVLGFGAAITLVTSLGVGLLPAFRTARADLRPALGSGRIHGDARRAGLRGALLLSQFAFGILLLIGAALLAQSFRKLIAVEVGFDPVGVLAVWLDLPKARYPNRVAQQRFYEEVRDRVGALPGVRSVATTSEPPISGYRMTFSFAIEGRPSANPSGREDPVEVRVVSPGYLETMKIPLVRGRALEARDRDGAPPVVVVDGALARRFWPGADPVGQRVSFVGPEGPWHEIVGIVGATRHEGLDAPAAPALYMTFAQRRENWGWMSWQILMVRAEPGLDPTSLAQAVRGAVWALDENLPIQSIATLEGLYRESTARRRFAMQLATAFGGLALILCGIGIYGVVASAVAERRQEIGIRIALGARPGQIVAGVIRVGIGLAVVGVALGTAAATGLTRFLQTLLFEIDPVDPASFAAMAGVLLLVAGLAAWLPARSAASVDPLRALRHE
jgi:putative ABC transport system permease protein